MAQTDKRDHTPLGGQSESVTLTSGLHQSPFGDTPVLTACTVTSVEGVNVHSKAEMESLFYFWFSRKDVDLSMQCIAES